MQESYLPSHWRLSASFHIQKGENKVSAVKSSDVTCTKRLSLKSWKYSVHESAPAKAACMHAVASVHGCRASQKAYRHHLFQRAPVALTPSGGVRVFEKCLCGRCP